MSKCPITEDWSLWTPCPLCGALGPWFDSGDCPGPRIDTGDDLHQILGEALKKYAHPPAHQAAPEKTEASQS